MPKINKSLKRLRKKGYEVKSILDIVANSNDTSTIVYTSQIFQPFSETFSNRYAFVGPIIQDTSVSLEKPNIPTVYISLGTVNNNNKIFYRHCFEELKNENLRIIMSVGESINIENIGEIPKNFIVKKYVDQISVLQVTDVFITHCGMNSVSEALYFGIPLVLFPQTTEQYGIASRVKELNAGMFLENNHIKDTVLTVLNNQSFKDNALKISDSFKKCGGAKEAAQFIVNKSCNNR
jgi:MGT family glycosyltransferase